MPCISVTFDPTRGPIVNLVVAFPRSLCGPMQPPTIMVPALCDTGASKTCIAKQVAQQMNLPIIGKTPMISASHTIDVDLYLADLSLPFGDPTQQVPVVVTSDVQLMEFNGDGVEFQVLLGRDILCLGLFSMAGHDRKFTICL